MATKNLFKLKTKQGAVYTVDDVSGESVVTADSFVGASTATMKLVTANTTLTAADSGKVILCNTADLVITLPATVAGLKFTIVTGVLSTGTGTSVSPASVDKIIGNGFTAADDKDAINTGASDVLGDLFEVTGDGSLGWIVTSVIGTWARET